MRILHVVSQDRNEIKSSYPSEPLLAEAAARQLECYRLEEGGRSEHQPASYIDPAIVIIEAALGKALLDKVKVGEMCARLLLTQAHDSAVVEDSGYKLIQEDGDEPNFNQPVSVVQFLKELLDEGIAAKFLASRSDLPENHKKPTSDPRSCVQKRND